MLRRGGQWDKAARRLFGGAGSYGNGAAMLAAPIGLLYSRNPALLRDVAEKSASITHAHELGKEGAALIAFAVALALESDSDVDVHGFLGRLKDFCRSEPFSAKLDEVGRLLD